MNAIGRVHFPSPSRMTLAQKVVILKLLAWIYSAMLAASIGLSTFDSLHTTRFLLFTLPSVMVPVATLDSLFKYDVAIRVAIFFTVVAALVEIASFAYFMVRATEDDFEPFVEGDTSAFALMVMFAGVRILLTIPICRLLEQVRCSPFENRFQLKNAD